VIVRFGEFTLDSGTRQLLRGGEPLHLSRKAFDALCVLVDRRPAAVTKEELHARLWPGVFVVDANLSVAIAEIRRALGDAPQAPRFIRTVHRVGYAFCADSQEERRESGDGQEDRRAWFLLKDRLLRLHPGENLIGRDPECDVWVDEKGVSRRHARVRVEGDAFTIEDLGSKNGTFVNGAAVEGPHRISDGDRVRLGPVDLDFRTRSSAATETIRIGRP
jgi:DNA-binding winged helix-turn-helix (wHTH) protein